MIDFEKAIKTATDNAKTLIQNANNFELDSVLVSDDNKLYEVSLTYDIKGKNPLDGEESNNATSGNSGLLQLAKIMSYRRGSKTFLVDRKNGAFRGFKNNKNG